MILLYGHPWFFWWSFLGHACGTLAGRAEQIFMVDASQFQGVIGSLFRSCYPRVSEDLNAGQVNFLNVERVLGCWMINFLMATQKSNHNTEARPLPTIFLMCNLWTAPIFFKGVYFEVKLFFYCNGIRWPLIYYLHQQFTVLNNHLCALDTTLRMLNTIQITRYCI